MLDIVRKIRAEIAGALARIRRARTEGALTLTSPRDLWVLRSGDLIEDATGRRVLVPLRNEQTLFIPDGLVYPLTVRRAD